MQLGFVIDHSRCIGCHACTVACKSENDVPLGNFRTWVKYTETGSFPSVKRSFAVLRCNQCTNAPCVTICPVHALDKGSNGIVDVDPDRCIGCKSCMQACPYDALYINDASGTAQKCHFCAHRVEQDLAPACAVVCPTEAIIPGDFDDPKSRVSKMRASGELKARKTEAGTGPNVFYREVADAGIDPLQTNAAGGYLWANQIPNVQVASEQWEAMEARASGFGAASRTVYDIQNPPLWGWKVSAYLFTKAIAAGVVVAATPLVLSTMFHDVPYGETPIAWAAGIGLAFLAITAVLLVADLKRPARFLFILRYPNWSSWLTRGAVILGLYGLLLVVLLLLFALGIDPGFTAAAVLMGLTAIVGGLTAVYTAWLFAQAKGRVWWMRRQLARHLFFKSWLAGCAVLILIFSAAPFESSDWAILQQMFGLGLMAHALFIGMESTLFPAGRRAEFERTARLVKKGPFAVQHKLVGVGVGVVVPLLCLGVAFGSEPSWVLPIGAVAALIGLASEEDLLVRAGQALPIH